MTTLSSAAETCSQRRAACLQGEKSRGQHSGSCEQAFPVCMKTGVWETQGRHGRRIEGIVRK